MHHCKRLAQLLLATVLVCASPAFAQDSAPAAADPAATPSAEPAATGETAPAPATGEATPAGSETASAGSETTVAAANVAKPFSGSHFGVGARWRWATVPSWFLGLFTEKNVPLSTFNSWAIEGFWRMIDKEDRNRSTDIVVAVGYQNMSPPDGYWLGKGKEPTLDADLVQARNLGLITLDAAYVVRQYFSPYFGIHYGAGLGLGIVRGRILRTSATYDSATGQYSVVSGGAQICDANGKCNEKLLADTQTAGVPDGGPTQPHRFQENSVPSALPIINLLFGLDFPIPQAPGLEFRVEGGFYDAFFAGISAGYGFR